MNRFLTLAQYGHLGEPKNLFLLPSITAGFLCNPAHNLLTKQPELSKL